MGTSTPDTKKFADVTTVTLFAGKERTQFIVHQEQLCEVSTFFKAAFTSQFRESSEQTMELQEDESETVDLFVQWLYARQCPNLSLTYGAKEARENDDDYLIQPFKLLIFADKYDITEFKTSILRALIDHAFDDNNNFLPNMDEIEFIYRNTCRSSGLRRFISHWYASWCGPEWYARRSSRKMLLEVPMFAVDLLSILAEKCDRLGTDRLLSSNPEDYMADEEIVNSADESDSE